MDAATTLKKHGLKVTKIRLAILEQLNCSGRAKSYAELQQELSDYDRTTLYRTINKLIEKGLIHRALEDSGDSYYALCSTCGVDRHNHDHIHFKCNECGRVECMDIDTPLKLPTSWKYFDSIEITARGTCTACA